MEADAGFHVGDSAGAAQARRNVRAFAIANGLEPRAADELALAISELVGNLVRHASAGGDLSWSHIEVDGRSCIEVTCRDAGPGIRDLANTLLGGTTTAGGMGQGLGVVRRLVDDFQIESSSEGTIVRIRKFVP